MPIYEYKCVKGHVFEVMQSFSDDALTQCEVCGAAVQKVFHPVSVHFKGSGFYNTDYGTKRRAREKEREAASSSGSDGAGGSSGSDGAGGGSSSDGSSGAATSPGSGASGSDSNSSSSKSSSTSGSKAAA